MAENLGQAQLTLTVDLSQFSKDLQAAKRLVASELGDVSVGARSGSRSTGGQRNTELAAERRARAERRREERADAARRKKEQSEINNAARNGGRRENIRALEIAQEKRFRLARRIDALEERGADVARLRTRLGQLTETQSNRQFGSFRRISTELARQVTLEERKTQARRRAEREARQLATRGASQGGASESINALEQAQNRRFRLSQRINRLEESGVKVTSLRSKLGDLTTSYAQRQFGTAKQLTNELARQVALTEARARREREIQQQLDKRARAGGARSPIRGSKDTPGSPAFLEEQRRQEQQRLDRAARIGGPREPIRGRKDLPGSPAFLEAQVRRSSQIYEEFLKKQAAELKRSAQAGGPRSPISGVLPGGIRIPGSPAFKARQVEIANNWKVFLDDLVDNKKTIDKSSADAAAKIKGPALPVSGRLINGQVIPGSPADRQRKLQSAGGGGTPRGPALPISGRLVDGSAVPGSPAALADAEQRLSAARKQVERDTRRLARDEQKSREKRNKRFSEAAGNAIIGGAFPALFGQGLGASIGGAAGGGLGGLLGGNFGFGLSLVGTALGQRFDDINKALENPIANFDQLKTSGALSSKSLEKYAEGLIETGRTAEAAALIQRDLAGTFGANNLRAFAELRSASDELNRSFGEAAGSVGAFVAGPLAAFLRSIAGGLDNLSTATQFEAVAGDLNPEQYRQVRDVTDRATRDAQRARGGLPFLPPTEGDVTKGRQAGIEEARRLLGIKEEEKRLEEAIARARLQTTQELSNNYRLISAQVQGNRTAQLDERANTAIDERNKRLRELAAQKITDPNDARVVDANQTAAKELFRIEEERLQLQREINRTIAEEALKRGQIAQQIEATRARRDAALAAGDFAANPGNSFLGARAGAAEGASFLAQNQLRVEQAITAERRLQAQLAFESDPTKRSQIAEQLTTAAAEVRAAGVEAGAALAERAASAAQSLRGAQDSLRGTLQSNFRLLPQAQRQGLLDAARADIARGRENGIIRDTIRPVGRARTFEIADFVRNVEQQQAQVASQQALIDALNTNSNAERNIRINVTLNGDGSANVSQTEQQAALL